MRVMLQGTLRACGLELRRPPRVLLEQPEARLTVTLDHLVALLVAQVPDPFFIEIGAFDGRSGDQLHEFVSRYRWRGILVEPQPAAFRELERTYAEVEGLDLRNVAIGERNETRELYSIDPAARGLPDWAPQVATFDRSRLEGAGFGNAIRTLPVRCVTFPELLTGVERVDLLQVDAEGFDAEIIRMFDFDQYTPRVVRFENVCLTRSEHDTAVARLVSFGYRVTVADTDTLGWHD